MEPVMGRVALSSLSVVAMAMLFAGLSMLVAGVPLLGMLAGSSVAGTIGSAVLRVSGAFVIAGAVAVILSRRLWFVLPNEREAAASGGPPALAGWLPILTVVLIAVPIWLVVRLRPFLAEWRQVIDMLATPALWQQANANGSGLVVVPIAGALAPAGFELAATAGFVLGAPLVAALLALRSERFPRIYLTWIVLLTALVAASVVSASAAMATVAALRDLVDTSPGRADEAAQITTILARYTAAIGPTAPVLVWTLGALLVWVPPVVFSRRARATFAARERSGPADAETALDVETITTPPRFPG